MLLSSKSQLDTCEAIRALSFLHKYGFAFCKVGMKKILTLIYSNEKSVQQAVKQCYRNLYFDEHVSVEEQQHHLFALMQDATLTDVTCIELLIGELINENTFGRQIFSRLWSTYINCRADLGQV